MRDAFALTYFPLLNVANLVRTEAMFGRELSSWAQQSTMRLTRRWWSCEFTGGSCGRNGGVSSFATRPIRSTESPVAWKILYRLLWRLSLYQNAVVCLQGAWLVSVTHPQYFSCGPWLALSFFIPYQLIRTSSSLSLILASSNQSINQSIKQF